MLYTCFDILQFRTFSELFRKRYEQIRVIDLSKLSSQDLAAECDSIVLHHKECAVFLGYLEPGWMLEPSHQTRIRKLIRKFPVAILLQYDESLPYSWKNEIDIIYTDKGLNKYGEPVSVHDGSAVHDESKI
jgi:hypothetical protein